MPVSRDQLLRILAIGHNMGVRGGGLSLHDAIQRSGYRELRKQFSALDLVPLIQAQPELITQWAMYSEDKRTSGGFAISETSPEAIADYIVRELDFWASVQ